MKTVHQVKTLLLERAGDKDVANQLKASKAMAGFEFEWRSLMATVVQVFQDGKITVEDADPVSTALEELYDDYIAQLDIPGVPAVLQSTVDRVLKGLIRPAVTQLFEAFASE